MRLEVTKEKKPKFEDVIEKEPFFDTEDGKLKKAIIDAIKDKEKTAND